MSTIRAHQILEDIILNRIVSEERISETTTWQQMRAHYAGLIFAAQKFYIGNVRDVPVVNHVMPELVRLPSPLMYADLEIAPPEGEDEKAIQYGVILIEKPPHPSQVEGNAFFRELYDRLLLISYTFLRQQGDSSWTFAPWTNAVVREENGPGIDIVTEADSFKVKDLVKVAAPFIVDYHGAIVSFLHLINCPNVTVEKIPAPVKLNKKREEKNRPPIQEYSIVKLPNYSAGQPHQGGTHASPRAHFRRGHIRRLAENKVTWVTHTMVKGEGFVPKHYVRG